MRLIRSALAVAVVLAVTATVTTYYFSRDRADAASGGAAVTGVYRNWFAHIGKDQAQVDAKLADFYTTYFTEKGPVDQRIYQPVGADMANCLSTYEDDTRSEGNSWCMMIALQMNDQARFDKLWTFAKTYMQCPNVNTDCAGLYDNLFIWHVDDDAPYRNFTLGDGTPEYTPAPDGDIYFATALLMASQRWGDTTGHLNYRTEAGKILNAMKDTGSLQPGELSIFNPDTKVARFVPTWIEGSGSLVDTSYQLPGFYEYWARLDPTVANRPYWNDAAGAARRYWADVIAKAGNPGNGIFPDCTKQDGGPLDTYSCASGYKYGSDGWRTIQNVAMDHYWWNGEANDGQSPVQAEVDWADQFLAFTRDKRDNLAGEYRLDGTPAAEWSGNAGQQLMTATAAMLATDEGVRNDWLQTAWDATPVTGEWRYYHLNLHMLGLLHLGGHYRAWTANGAGGTPTATVEPTPSATVAPSAAVPPPATVSPTPTAPAPTLTAEPAGTAPAPAPIETSEPSAVFDDAYAEGWEGEAWNGSLNARTRRPAHGGTGYSIAFTPAQGWAAAAFTSTDGPHPADGLKAIKLRVYGGTNGGSRLHVMVNPDATGAQAWSRRVPITAAPGAWTEVTVTIEQLGAPRYIGAIAVQDATGERQPRFLLDDIRLV